MATKLTVPAPPRPMILRPRLYPRLNAGGGRKLTVVAAPAGYGKTVLAAEWLAADTSPARPVAWVSLDRSDNDPSRFWAYVLAALAGSGVEVSPACYGAIERAGPGPAEDAVAPLLNALAASPSGHILVLDDFHVITAPAVHAEVEYLINRLPPGGHIMILSRSEPPLPLARWTARDEMVELRAGDLAFSRDEMARFLHHQDVDLPDGVVDTLFTRLGGWAAALRLITVWVARSPDPAAAVASFAAGDFTVADYLTREVLDQLDGPTRRFVSHTCVLERMTGALCDAVTGEAGGSAALADLHRRQLFVETLDDTGQWYRYHQLFEELLRNQLARDEPAQVAERHRRAASWLADHGLVGDALTHHFAAGDWAGARARLLRETLFLGTRYDPRIVEGWLSAVPPEEVAASAFFLMTKAFVTCHTGRLAEAKQALGAAQTLVGAAVDPELPELAALVQLVFLGVARMECDLEAAERRYQGVCDELTRSGGDRTVLGWMALAAAKVNLAATRFWHGQGADAEGELRQLEAETRNLDRMRLHALSTLALITATTGRLREGEELAAQALGLAQEVGLTTTPQAGLSHLALAVVRLERGQPEQARIDLEEVVDRSRAAGDRPATLLAEVLLARATANGGDQVAALSLLDDAKRSSAGWTPPAPLCDLIAAEEVRLCLARGDLGSARAALSEAEAARADQSRSDAAQPAMTRARILLAEGQTPAARRDLDAAAQTATVAGDKAAAVEALVLGSVASRAAHDLDGALTRLDQALALGETEHIVRAFVESAAAVRPLLIKMEDGTGDFARAGYRQRLLQAMGVAARRTALTAPAPAGAQLSDRELTVLRLLRGSLRNAEIAGTLSISENTLKTHIKHIFSKLDVTDRAAALTKADQLDLI